MFNKKLLYWISLYNQIEGESGLHECEFNEACNIVHNRFWMPILAERLCRCPDGQECPWNWNVKPDNKSISVNNRSVLQVKYIHYYL